MYVDYGYYSSGYGGSLSEAAFKAAEPKAEAELRYLTFVNGDIFAKEDDLVKIALCAATDIVAQAQKEAAETAGASGAAGIKSESNDGYSVTYVTDAKEGQTAEEALRARIAQGIRLYLLPTGWLRRKVPCCGC